MKQLKLAIFDMDGLLLDSERWSIASFKKIAETLGFEPDMDAFLKGMGRKQKKGIEELLIGCPKEKALEVSQKAEQIYEECLKELCEQGTDVLPGVEEILAYLKKQGVRCVVASSSSRRKVESLMGKSGILEYFVGCISGDDVKTGKPDPEIFLKACSLYDVSAIEALVFEDSDNGAMAAYQAKIPFVLVEDLAYISDDARNSCLCLTDRIDKAIPVLEQTYSL